MLFGHRRLACLQTPVSYSLGKLDCFCSEEKVFKFKPEGFKTCSRGGLILCGSSLVSVCACTSQSVEPSCCYLTARVIG